MNSLQIRVFTVVSVALFVDMSVFCLLLPPLLQNSCVVFVVFFRLAYGLLIPILPAYQEALGTYLVVSMPSFFVFSGLLPFFLILDFLLFQD